MKLKSHIDESHLISFAYYSVVETGIFWIGTTCVSEFVKVRE